jgi:hypothetical protein
MKTGLYRHYKGGLYQVLGIGEHTETKERCVVYVALAPLPGPRLRIRPLEGKDGWLTRVDDDGGRDDKGLKRFTYIGDELP